MQKYNLQKTQKKNKIYGNSNISPRTNIILKKSS